MSKWEKAVAWTMWATALVLLALYVTGCVAATKRHIAADLTKIAQYQDCPTICDELKVYIRAKLGGVVQ